MRVSRLLKREFIKIFPKGDKFTPSDRKRAGSGFLSVLRIAAPLDCKTLVAT